MMSTFHSARFHVSLIFFYSFLSVNSHAVIHIFSYGQLAGSVSRNNSSPRSPTVVCLPSL